MYITPIPQLPPVSHEKLFALTSTQYAVPCVRVAVSKGIFDYAFKVLESQGSGITVKQVMKELKFGEKGAEVMLNSLVALEYLQYIGDQYYLNVLSQTYLVTSSPFYHGNMFSLHADESFNQLMNAIEADFKEGPNANKKSAWMRAEFPKEKAEKFIAGMHSYSMAVGSVLAATVDFKKKFDVTKLLDVGGGSGSYCMCLARNQPEIAKFTIFEIPTVAEICRGYLSRATPPLPSPSRIEVVAGNMFKDPLPLGHNAVFFSNIFHDWEEDLCQMLCKKSFDALPSGGHLFLIEAVLSESKSSPPLTTLFSLYMFAVTNARQFTFNEFKSMMEKAGFKNVGLIPVFGIFSLIHARKP